MKIGVSLLVLCLQLATHVCSWADAQTPPLRTKNRIRSQVYEETPPMSQLLAAVKGGLGRIGHQGADLRAVELFPPGGRDPFKDMPGMLHELQRPIKSRSSPHDGLLTGPNKRRRPAWHRLLLDTNLQGLSTRASEIVLNLKTLSSVVASSGGFMHQLHMAAWQAQELVHEIHQITAQVAAKVDAEPYMNKVRFMDVWDRLRDSSRINAQIMADEARLSLKEYVIDAWADRALAAVRDVNVDRDAHDAFMSGIKAMDVAKRLGNKLLDKADKRETIHNILEEAKRNPESQQVAIVLAETETIHLPGHEKPVEALERESDALDVEIEILQVPTFSLVEAAVMAKREANMAARINQEIAIIDEAFTPPEGKSSELSEWRKQRLQDLEALIREDAPARQNRQRQNIAMDTSRRSSIAVAEQDARRDSDLDRKSHIGFLILQAVPAATAPVLTSLAFGRQAERWARRIRRYLREQIRHSQEAIRRAETFRVRIHDIMEKSKVAVPEKLSEWAAERSPKQVISRLKAMKQVGAPHTAPLNDLIKELDDIKVPTEEPGEDVVLEGLTGERKEEQTEESEKSTGESSTADESSDATNKKKTQESTSVHARRKKKKKLKTPVALMLNSLEVREVSLFSPPTVSTGRPAFARLQQSDSYDTIKTKLDSLVTQPNVAENPRFWLLLDELAKTFADDDDENEEAAPQTMLDAVFREVMFSWKMMAEDMEEEEGGTGARFVGLDAPVAA